MTGTNHPMLIAWNEKGQGIIEGYSGDSGRVSIYNASALRAVSGNISSVNYDSTGKMNIIEFSGKGKFRLEPSNGIAPSPEHGGIAITAFPNPSADGNFTISLNSGAHSSAVIKITDGQGKTLKSRMIPLRPGVNNLDVSLADMPAGAYLLSVNAAEFSSSLALIKCR